ncbi:MAG TPA: PilZ domain-containing protein [Vicinamibacteria bacterium]
MSTPDPAVKGQARGQIEARIIDLSKGGARLALPAPLDVGSLHSFSLRVGGETVLVHAKVRRCGPADGGHEVAVEFVGMAPQDAARLNRYLEG